MNEAAEEFRHIAEAVKTGDVAAIAQLKAAGDALIEAAAQVGASSEGEDARKEISAVTAAVLADLAKAQAAASAGIEAEIRRVHREQIKTLNALIEETKKLRRT